MEAQLSLTVAVDGGEQVVPLFVGAGETIENVKALLEARATAGPRCPSGNPGAATLLPAAPAAAGGPPARPPARPPSSLAFVTVCCVHSGAVRAQRADA